MRGVSYPLKTLSITGKCLLEKNLFFMVVYLQELLHLRFKAQLNA
jgi:hypothetical protein